MDKYYKEEALEKGSQSGDVILTIGRPQWWNIFGKFVTGAIQKVTGGPFCHLAMKVKCGNIIEAVADGIKLKPFKKYINKRTGLLIFHNDRLTDNQMKAVLRFLYTCVNLKVKYDYRGLFRFIAPWIGQEKSEYFCSENGTKAFNIAQLDYIVPGLDIKISNKKPEDTTPNDIFKYLLSLEGFKNGWMIRDSQNIDIDKLLEDFSK